MTMLDSRPARRHVFVYGTLRAGGSNDIRRWRPVPEFVGAATVAATLFDLGDYPGALLGGTQPVRGEVYRITAALEAQLDRLEGVQPDGGGEYVKREVRAAIDDGRACRCLFYEIHPRGAAGRPAIDGGDWLAHVAARRLPPAIS